MILQPPKNVVSRAVLFVPETKMILILAIGRIYR